MNLYFLLAFLASILVVVWIVASINLFKGTKPKRKITKDNLK